MDNQLNKLLVVEDDPGLQSQYRWSFDAYDVTVVDTRENAIAMVRRDDPPVVLLDLGLPPDTEGVGEGFATLTDILKLKPHTKIIVVTGRNDHENAVRAIGLGAYDFYSKPIDLQIISLILQRAYRIYDLEIENQRLAHQMGSSPLDGILAVSENMLRICRQVEKVAPTDATALLLGESGTGKELLARAIHNLSLRADKPFVVINCASIPETLLESELFGYEKGAFTGAISRKQGKVEYAEGGTLFLDEIGDLPLTLQAKILRFLQERVIERIGGREEIPVDLRVVCATHQDLEDLNNKGLFREDLFYRVSEVTLRIPPLRDRPGDALLLARKFLTEFAKKNERVIKGFTEEATQAIEQFRWPGNVRELENKIMGAAIMTEGSRITPQDLGLEVSSEEPVSFSLRKIRDDCERQAIQQALVYAAGNISKASKLLGVSRPTLYDLMQKHHLNIHE